MSDHYDRYETRPPKSRENAFFRDLRAIVSVAKSRAAGLRHQMRSINIAEIKKHEDLSRIPLLRKSDLRHLQADHPPYAGFVATRAGALRHVMIDCVEGHSRDWWGAARALAAAGFKANDIILNCFSYHLSSAGHIVDSGAAALGCAVIPAGKAAIEKQLDVIHRLRPQGFCGKPHFLKQLLERAAELNRDVSSIKRALVFGAPLDQNLRNDIEERGIHLRQAFASSDVGIIAYETDAPDGSYSGGMVVNEGLMLEIVKPGTAEPAAKGEIGEVVISRLNQDYPLLRLATGDLSRFLTGQSPCGRTNMRIDGWLGRADQIVHVGTTMLLPSQVMQVAAAHAEVLRARLCVATTGLVLRVETKRDDAALRAALATTLRNVTGLDGQVEILPPGGLPHDRKFIVDERWRP
jgi:phenylacetate-CoA ligase